MPKKEEKKQEKPGYKTTEFIVCLVVLLLGALMQSGVISDGGSVSKITGGAMEVLAALGYLHLEQSNHKARGKGCC